MNSPISTPPVTVWQLKPWWCQPWSILLTSVVLIGGSWLLLHRVWVTLLVAIPVLIWMGFFLGLYPKMYAQQMAALDANVAAVEASAADEMSPPGSDNNF